MKNMLKKNRNWCELLSTILLSWAMVPLVGCKTVFFEPQNPKMKAFKKQ